MVRKEAVTTLCKIFSHRKIPSAQQDILYSTFAHCVVVDLHWEVKLGALHFWEIEIDNQFTNQGMIDGTFPMVTFSKEHKKIVKLTSDEINLRIAKVFNTLAQRGCWGVLLKCLDEDCDVEVIRSAVSIVQRLLDKLKTYDYESVINKMESSPLNHISLQNDYPLGFETDTSDMQVEQSSEYTDNVIESIISSLDINLLSLSESYTDEKKAAIPSKVSDIFYKQFTGTSPKDFLATLKRIDLNELQHNQQQWILSTDTLSSLLEDILIIMGPQQEESIVADCY